MSNGMRWPHATLLATAMLCAQVQSWTYSEHGKDWPAQFPYCSGRAFPERLFNNYQAPVNVEDDGSFGPVDEPPEMLSRGACTAPGRITNGHSWEVTYSNSSCKTAFTTRFGGLVYNLDQYHLHSGGENLINGHRSAMELHLVHDDPTEHGTYDLVLAIRLEVAPNDSMPDIHAISLQTLPTDPYMGFIQLLAARRSTYFTFLGSMTTPDCRSDVRWILFNETLTISPEMLHAFIADVGPSRTDGVRTQMTDDCPELPHNPYCSYREVQPLNSREVRTGRLLVPSAEHQ